ncbi:MAG: hypothetical protein KJZ78_26390, partial [Bryobacteraceae bacterium]|nr:hypothetical protein [Bryobacteraceae bacterium]
DYFLNVMKPSVNPDEKLPPITKAETEAAFGASITKDGRKYVVTFSKDSSESPRLEITAR